MRRSAQRIRSSGSSCPATLPARWEWTDFMRKYGIVALVAATAAALVVALVGGASYTVKVLLGSPTNLVVRGTVEVKGFKAGTISALRGQSGKAGVTIQLRDRPAP